MADPDALIAERWPAAWAKANDPRLRDRSKARQQIRQRYRHAVAFDQFRDANPSARCGNCAHATLNPGTGIKGLSCDLDSDFHGYAMTKADSVCVRWKQSTDTLVEDDDRERI